MTRCLTNKKVRKSFSLLLEAVFLFNSTDKQQHYRAVFFVQSCHWSKGLTRPTTTLYQSWYEDTWVILVIIVQIYINMHDKFLERIKNHSLEGMEVHFVVCCFFCFYSKMRDTYVNTSLHDCPVTTTTLIYTYSYKNNYCSTLPDEMMREQWCCLDESFSFWLRKVNNQQWWTCFLFLLII